MNHEIEAYVGELAELRQRNQDQKAELAALRDQVAARDRLIAVMSETCTCEASEKIEIDGRGAEIGHAVDPLGDTEVVADAGILMSNGELAAAITCAWLQLKMTPYSDAESRQILREHLARLQAVQFNRAGLFYVPEPAEKVDSAA